MPRELAAGVLLYHWLFSLVAGIALAAIAFALVLAWFSRRRGWAALAAAALLALGGLIALGSAALVATERWPIRKRNFGLSEYGDDLEAIALHAVAVGIGVALVGALVGVALVLVRRRGPAVRVAAALVVALVLVLGASALLAGVEEAIGVEGRFHPDGARAVAGFRGAKLGNAGFATGLAATARGEVFYAEHSTGRIGVLVPDASGVYQDRTFAQVDIPPDGRLFHLALHPQWPQQPYLYATAHEHSGDAQRLRIVRVRSTAELQSTETTTLVRGLPTEDPRRGAEADHFGSALAACGEFLFVSIGDTDSPGSIGVRRGVFRRAQFPDQAEGKVLRYRFEGADLRPAGLIHPDPPVYAMGFRNPFAMTCDPETGYPIVADNGAAGRDQVRLVQPSSNHEWPLSDARDLLTPPIWDSGTRYLAPTGVVARASGGRTEIAFSSFHLGAVYRLQTSSARTATGGVDIIYELGGPILAMAAASDGCVYASDSTSVWLIADAACPRNPATARAPGRFDGPPPAVFAANCAACHGQRREGGYGPPLRPERLTAGDSFYVRTILEGRPGTLMPGWRQSGMTEQQARAILDYLRRATDEAPATATPTRP